MQPPSNDTFSSSDQFFQAMQEHAFSQCFAVVKMRSSSNQMYIQCVHSGSPSTSNNTSPQRQKRSRKTGCPYLVYASKKGDGLWHSTVKNPDHNHPPAPHALVYPEHRKLTPTKVNEVARLSAAGAKPRVIAATLRQQNLYVTSRDIYNTRSRISTQFLSQRNPMQAMVDFAHEKQYHVYVDTQNSTIKRVFLLHPKAKQYLGKYHFVLLFDNTYKTNRYKMPLMHVVGMVCTGKTFTAGIAFLEGEDESNYTWALNHLSRFVPLPSVSTVITDKDTALMNSLESVFVHSKHLLCIWHVNKNVESKARKLKCFETEDQIKEFQILWGKVLYAKDENEYVNNVTNLLEFLRGREQFKRYLEDTWLNHKERFVSAWTDKVINFGLSTTSRNEGAHSMLKRYMESSRLDLLQAFRSIDLAWENQLFECQHSIDDDKIKFPMNYDLSLYNQLISKVSSYALRKIKEQELLIETSSDICTDSFKTIMGLPCVHELRRQRFLPITIDQIHRQWLLDGNYADENSAPDDVETWMNEFSHLPRHRQLELISTLSNRPVIPNLREPNIANVRGRPIGSNANIDTSTRRLPSSFELNHETGRRRTKCTSCHGFGHNRRTCPQVSEMSQ